MTTCTRTIVARTVGPSIGIRFPRLDLERRIPIDGPTVLATIVRVHVVIDLVPQDQNASGHDDPISDVPYFAGAVTPAAPIAADRVPHGCRAISSSARSRCSGDSLLSIARANHCESCSALSK